jgi:hypothetical protein
MVPDGISAKIRHPVGFLPHAGASGSGQKREGEIEGISHDLPLYFPFSSGSGYNATKAVCCSNYSDTNGLRIE